MLSTIKDKAKGPIFKSFMFLLALSFIGWGVGDFINANQFGAAITVDGTEISAQDVERAWQGQMKQLEQQVGPEVAKQLAQEMQLDRRLVDGMVQNTLIQNAARKMKMIATDQMIAGTIQAQPYFAGIDGKFDQARYEAVLRNAALSPRMFEDMVSDQIRDETLRSAFMGLSLVDPKAFERYVTLSTQTRDVKVLRITEQDVPPVAEPTAQQIEDAYLDRKEEFKTEEKRDVAVMVLDISPFMDKVSIDPAKLAEANAAAAARASADAERHARHILVATEDEANDIVAQLKNGGDFATIAKAKSIDTGSGAKGGDLGFAGRGVMVPSFEEAMFALKVGEISAPVQSDFGWHVIQLLAIKPVDQATVAKLRAEAEATLKRDAAEPEYITMQENIDDRIAGGETLDAIAKEFGLSLTRYNALPRSGNGTEVLGGQQVLAEAFRMNEGEVSTPLTLAPQKLAYVMAGNVVPEDYKPLSEVRDILAKSLKAEALRASERSLGEALIAEAKAGKSLEDIATARQLKTPVQVVPNVGRQSQGANPLIGDLLVERIFQTANGKLVEGVHPAPGGVVVVQVVGINNRSVSEGERRLLQQTYHNTYQDDTYKLFTWGLKDKADIEINQKVINRITGFEREAQ